VPLKDPVARAAYLREYHKCWYEKNKVERFAQIKSYQASNPQVDKAWRKKNVKKLSAKRMKWRDKNRERDNRNRRIWAKLNPHKTHLKHPRKRRDNGQYAHDWYTRNKGTATERRKTAISAKQFAEIQEKVSRKKVIRK
jgi:hypothetical protein